VMFFLLVIRQVLYSQAAWAFSGPYAHPLSRRHKFKAFFGLSSTPPDPPRLPASNVLSLFFFIHHRKWASESRLRRSFTGPFPFFWGPRIVPGFFSRDTPSFSPAIDTEPFLSSLEWRINGSFLPSDFFLNRVRLTSCRGKADGRAVNGPFLRPPNSSRRHTRSYPFFPGGGLPRRSPLRVQDLSSLPRFSVTRRFFLRTVKKAYRNVGTQPEKAMVAVGALLFLFFFLSRKSVLCSASSDSRHDRFFDSRTPLAPFSISFHSSSFERCLWTGLLREESPYFPFFDQKVLSGEMLQASPPFVRGHSLLTYG